MASFVDTNVLVYAHDHGSIDKQNTARELLRSADDDLVISTQVLAEFYWTVTRKLTPPLSESDAAAATRRLASLPVVSTDSDLVLAAIDTSRNRRIALWDAMIVEAAVRGGCHRLVTEDLNHGQEIGGMRIENPFL